MVNVNAIEKQKKEIIKNFKPEEFEAYLKSLVSLYYESFLTQDKEKHLAVNTLIEEAVELYEAKGYDNTSYNKLVFEVNKANELLTETLIKKEEILKSAKYFLAESYSNKIYYLIHNNVILKDLIEVYEKAPSEILLENTKHILGNIESDLIGIKFLLEEKEVPENYLFKEDLEIMEEYYLEFLELQKKINSF